MASAPRVVVTGLGQVSSLGLGIEPFRERVFAGRPGVSRLGLDVPGLADPIGARIPGFDPEALLPNRALRAASPATRYAFLAGSEAFASAGLERVERPEAGVFVGSGFGGQATIEDVYRDCFTTPGARPRPGAIPTGMFNAAAGVLAAELRLKGPNLTFAVACSSGAHAIGQAFRLLRRGGAELMLAGGAEAPLTPLILAAWASMRVLARAGEDPARACRPFAADREGLVLGEGAAFLVLETLEHAARRGARPLGEILGYGCNTDAGHVTHPDPEGVRRSMELALGDAGVEPGRVGYVNAHGTATEVNDRVEAEAIEAVFGAGRVAVSSTKAVHGHAMGASAALEAIATLLGLAEGRLPPTANLAAPDPALPALDFVTGGPRAAAVEVALSNSFAFGGNNAVLVLGRP